MYFQTINPATNTKIETFKQHSWAEVQTMLGKAEESWKRYRYTSLEERKRLLLHVADELEQAKAELAALMTLEMGKPIKQAEAEVMKCAWVCRFYANEAHRFLQAETVDTDDQKSQIHFDPLGIILAIMPWNFPLWQVFRCAAPALMAGNAVLLKHAPNVPQCAQAIAELFIKAKYPVGLFSNLFISTKKVRWVIEDPRVQAVAFTGSDKAGAKVASLSGSNIKKTVLELGGSDPFIVLEDADLETAAKVAVQSRMLNNGQSCIAAKRLIVVQAVAQLFTELLKKEISQLEVGDPQLPTTDIGPIARPDLLKKLEKQVRSSVKLGANVVIGGKRKGLKGNFYLPTLLTAVNQGMPAFDDEIFGPVASLIIAKDEQDALRLANNTPFGLGASIWTRDEEKALRLAAQIQAGCVFINSMVKSDPRLPFGGIKRSGYGRELGVYGIREFVNVKTVVVG